jgi:hypothetical protein
MTDTDGSVSQEMEATRLSACGKAPKLTNDGDVHNSLLPRQTRDDEYCGGKPNDEED